MGRLLDMVLADVEIGIGAYSGGLKDNAICQSASATIVVKKKQSKAFEKYIRSFCESVLAEYGKTDPDFKIKCKDKGKSKLEVMSTKDARRFISLLNVIPNGVAKMSQSRDMVETSSNIGVALAKPKSFSICVSLRSNKEASLEWMISKVRILTEAFGTQFSCNGKYPAWEETEASDFALAAQNTYKKMFGSDIDILTIHAGLECAIFSEKIKGIDAISIGPDMFDVHTPSERLSISSTGREWRFLQELLKL